MQTSNHNSDNSTNTKEDQKNWLTYSGMAFEMFAIIGIFTALGFFLDKKFSTTPYLLLVLLAIGVAGAFYKILRKFS